MGQDTSAPILSASSSPAGLSGSLLFEFGDRLYATNFGCSEDHLVTRLQGVEHEAVLYLQILGSAATAAPTVTLCVSRDFHVVMLGVLPGHLWLNRRSQWRGALGACHHRCLLR